MAEELKIIIDADVSKAQAGLESVSTSAQKTADNLTKIAPAATSASTGLDTIANSTARIVPAATSVANASTQMSQGFAKIPQSANAAGQSLTTVTQVLDAFGKQGKLSIDTVEGAMAQLKAIIKQTADPTDANKLKSAFKELQNTLNSLKLQGGLETAIGGVTRSTRIAHQELDGLARTIAGFGTGGFRGIEGLSNIAFLFEQLEGKTGGLKGAFAVLSETLFSPAGIIIGLTAIAPLIEEVIANFTKTDEATKKAAESAKKLKDSINGIFEGTAKEVTDVVSLVAVLKSETETRERKLAAIQELNNIAPETFNNLKLEGDSVRNLDEDYKNYLSNIQTVIAAKIKQAQLEQLITELLKLQGVTLTQQERAVANFGKTLAQALSPKLPQDQRNIFLEKIQTDAQKTSKEINNIQTQIDALSKDLTSLSSGIKLKTDTTTATREISEFRNKIIALAKFESDIFNIPIDLKFQVGESAQQEFEKAKAIIKGIEDHTIRLKFISLTETNNIEAELKDIKVPQLQLQIDKPGFKKDLDELIKTFTIPLQVVLDEPTLGEAEDKIKQIFSAFGQTNIFSDAGRDAGRKFSEALLRSVEVFQKGFKISPNLNIDDVVNSLKQSLEPLNKITLNLLKSEDFKSAIRDLEHLHDAGVTAGQAAEEAFLKAGFSADEAAKGAQSIVDSFGGITKGAADAAEAISTGLTSAVTSLIDAFASGKNPAKAFFNAIVQSLEQVIAKIIQTQIEQAILNALFKAAAASVNPLALLGLVGFEKGGDPPVGRPSIVGEKGPEIIVPKSQMHVFSHDQSKALLSSSVKEYHELKDSFIKEKVSQYIKDYFRTFDIAHQLKESIKTVFVPIKETISESLRTISGQSEKIDSYSYQLHKLSDRATSSIISLKDSFEKSSSVNVYSDKIASFEKITDSISAVVNNLKESFVRSVTSSDKSKSFESSERFNDSFSSVINNLKTNFEKSYSERSYIFEKIANQLSNKETENNNTFSNIHFDKITSAISERINQTFKSDSQTNSYDSQLKVSEKLKEVFSHSTSLEKLFYQLSETLKEANVCNTSDSIVNSKEVFDSLNVIKSLPLLRETFTSSLSSHNLEKELKSSSDSKSLVSNERITEAINALAKSNVYERYFSNNQRENLLLEKIAQIKESSVKYFLTLLNNIKEQFTKTLSLFSKESFAVTDHSKDNRTISSNDFFTNKEKIIDIGKSYESNYTIKTFGRFNSPYTTLNSIKENFATFRESKKETTGFEYYFDKYVNSLKERSSNSFESSFFKSISSLKEHFSTVTQSLKSSVEKIQNNFSDKSVKIEKVITNNFYSSESFTSLKSLSAERIATILNLPKFASGGAVFAPTLALLGEGFGISRSNPEFVGTRDQLKGIQGGTFDLNVTVGGDVSIGIDKLAIALNAYNRSQLRTSGKKGF